MLLYLHPGKGLTFDQVGHSSSQDIGGSIHSSFAKTIVRAGKPQVWLSVLMPHDERVPAEGLARSVKTSVAADGAAVAEVVLPTSKGKVTIAPDGTWSVKRSALTAEATIEPGQGTFSDATKVAVTRPYYPEGAVIHYTLDGKEPTTDSAVYRRPLWLNSSARIRAQVFYRGKPAGRVTAADLNVRDRTAPQLEDLSTIRHGITASGMTLKFSEPLHRRSAERASNYKLDKDARVKKAKLDPADPTGSTVMLSTSELKCDTEYILTISNVRDASRKNKARLEKTFSFPGLLHGLRGEYYEGTGFQKLALQRLDERIKIKKGEFPHQQDNISIRWSGKIEIKTAGSYTFYTAADDGQRLWIDGEMVVDDWHAHGVVEKSATVDLEPGYHEFKHEFFQGGGGASIEVSWKGPGFQKRTLEGVLWTIPWELR